jgi:hypothetical protein
VPEGVKGFEKAFDLAPEEGAGKKAFDLAARRRGRVVWRLDGGGGTDANIRFLIQRGYHVVTKGYNSSRSKKWGGMVKRWTPCGKNRWIGRIKCPVDYGRPVSVVVVKREKKGREVYNHYIFSVTAHSGTALLRLYEARGGAEVEQFRNDKSGLSMEARRKHSFLGQEAYIILTDLAHNLLADFYHRALVGTIFKGYGPKRIVRDILAIPGQLRFDGDGHLAEVALLSRKQFSGEAKICLEKYLSGR